MFTNLIKEILNFFIFPLKEWNCVFCLSFRVIFFELVIFVCINRWWLDKCMIHDFSLEYNSNWNWVLPFCMKSRGFFFCYHMMMLLIAYEWFAYCLSIRTHGNVGKQLKMWMDLCLNLAYVLISSLSFFVCDCQCQKIQSCSSLSKMVK